MKEAFKELRITDEQEIITLVKKIVFHTLKKFPSLAIDHDDAIAEGLLAFCAVLQTFDPKRKDTYRSYCNIRVRGAVMDLIRRDLSHRNKTTTFEEFNFDSEVNAGFKYDTSNRYCPEQEHITNRLQNRLLRSLKCLPERERTIVIESVINGKSHQEIAESQMMKTRSFTSKVLNKSYQKLKKMLVAEGFTSVNLAI